MVSASPSHPYKITCTFIINPVIKSYFPKKSINFGFSIILSVNLIALINHMMLYTKGIIMRGFLIPHHYSNNQVNDEKATKIPPSP